MDYKTPMAGCRKKARVMSTASTASTADTGSCHLLLLGRYASMALGALLVLMGPASSMHCSIGTEHVLVLSTGIGCPTGQCQQLCPIGATQLVCQDPPLEPSRSLLSWPKDACMPSCMMQSCDPRQGSRMRKHSSGPIGASGLKKRGRTI